MENKIATCSKCQRQFHIIPVEQEFLQKRGLPLPTECPSCRQERRLNLRGSRNLQKAKCSKCGADIVIAFDPNVHKNPILCQKDYEQYFVENEPIITDPLPE